MTNRLVDDLGNLTGEELFHLISMLDRHMVRLTEATTRRLVRGEDLDGLDGVMLDTIDYRLDALMQIARISVPIHQAAAIIWRQTIARRRFQPMTPDAQQHQAAS